MADAQINRYHHILIACAGKACRRIMANYGDDVSINLDSAPIPLTSSRPITLTYYLVIRGKATTFQHTLRSGLNFLCDNSYEDTLEAAITPFIDAYLVLCMNRSQRRD